MNIAENSHHDITNQEASTDQSHPVDQADYQSEPSCRLDKIQPVLHNRSLRSDCSSDSRPLNR